MADQGGCSANEATSFASVRVAKRLCRIVRVVDYEIAVFITILKVTPLRRLHLIRAAKAAHLLLKEKTFGGCLFQLSHSNLPDSCTQPRPRGTLIADQRRACAARPKGKYSRGRMALAPIRAREFSLPRGGQGHSQFYSIGFYVYSAAFFGTFLGSKKVPSSRHPVPPSSPRSYPLPYWRCFRY